MCPSIAADARGGSSTHSHGWSRLARYLVITAVILLWLSAALLISDHQLTPSSATPTVAIAPQRRRQVAIPPAAAAVDPPIPLVPDHFSSFESLGLLSTKPFKGKPGFGRITLVTVGCGDSMMPFLLSWAASVCYMAIDARAGFDAYVLTDRLLDLPPCTLDVDVTFRAVRIDDDDKRFHLFRRCASTRLYLKEILPQHPVVLYTDLDTAFGAGSREIEDTITAFYEGNYTMAMAFDRNIGNTYHLRKFCPAVKVVKDWGFNSGVFLVNTDRFAKIFHAREVRLLNETRFLGDQCVLNDLYQIMATEQREDEVMVLPCTMNARLEPPLCPCEETLATIGSLDCAIYHGLRRKFTTSNPVASVPRTLLHLEQTLGSIKHQARAIAASPSRSPYGPVTAIRHEIGLLLERRGYRTGVEVGVQRGYFSARTLTDWPSCKSYTLVDLWQQQENYLDSANYDNKAQENIFRTATQQTEPFKDKGVEIPICRNYSTVCWEQFQQEGIRFDYAYIDARHDYEGALQDILLYATITDG